MPIAIGIRRKKPSLFLPKTSFEDSQEGQSGTGGTSSTTTSNEAIGPESAYHYPVIEILRPDSDNNQTFIEPPEELFAKGRAVMFPALKASQGGMLRVKYLNEWQLQDQDGGSRSSAKERGYRGYRGREVTFTAVINDADFTALTRSAQEIVDLLRVWATMETTQAWTERPLAVLRVRWKSEVSASLRVRLKQQAMEIMNGNNPGAFREKYKQYIEEGKESYFNTKRTGQNTEVELVNLNTPIPPLPLRFRFGTLIVAPCVIKKFDVTVNRYSQNRILSADLKLILQEIMNGDVWAVKDAPKERIIDVKMFSSAAPNLPRSEFNNNLEQLIYQWFIEPEEEAKLRR